MNCLFKQIATHGRSSIPVTRPILINLDDVSCAEETTNPHYGGTPLLRVYFRSGAPPVVIKGEPKDLLD